MSAQTDRVDRWERKVEDGTLEGMVVLTRDDRVLKYRFRYTQPGWADLQEIRFDHNPNASEPSHLHMRWRTRMLDPDGAEAASLVPKLLELYGDVAEVVS